jgi:hypothetical protein
MMKNMKTQTPLRRAGLALGVTLSLWVTGCASIGAPEQTHSLGPQIELQTQPDGAKSWRSAHPQRYQSVHIDPEAIVFDRALALDAEQRREMREAMVSALSQRFAAAGWRLQASATARETLTIKAHITEVQLANTSANILTTLLLIGPLSHGGVTVELQAQDSVSHEPVAALAITGRAGIEDIASAYSATGHARLQADGVAQRFVQVLASTVVPHVAAR